jgi:protein-disulfide isomerase
MCRKMWREVVNGALKDDIAAGKVAYRFVEFPLGLSPNSSAIAIAGKCAGEQGRYREFMNVVYSTKGEHGAKELTDFSHKAGLDIPKMNECMNSGRGKAAAKLDVAMGNALGVQGTPTFFINGAELQGNWTQAETWDGVVMR